MEIRTSNDTASNLADAQPKAIGPITITLAKTIQNIDQTLAAVTLMPPTGRHLMKAGSVMKMTTREEFGEVSIEMNLEGMGRLIGACGNLTVRAVENLSASDFMACSNALMSFLAPTATS